MRVALCLLLLTPTTALAQHPWISPAALGTRPAQPPGVEVGHSAPSFRVGVSPPFVTLPARPVNVAAAPVEPRRGSLLPPSRAGSVPHGGAGRFFASDRAWWLLFATAGAAHAADAITTWDAVAERRGVEGNPLLADATGHPRFGAIIGAKAGVLGLAFVTRRKWPRVSRWLLAGSIASAGTAAALNTTVGR